MSSGRKIAVCCSRLLSAEEQERTNASLRWFAKKIFCLKASIENSLNALRLNGTEFSTKCEDKKFFFTQTIKRYAYGTFLLLGFAFVASGERLDSPKGSGGGAASVWADTILPAFRGALDLQILPQNQQPPGEVP